MNPITRLLKIKYPILQGAMAQISTHTLVSAVSNAGGLGIIASGGMSSSEVRAEVRKCKELTDQPFAVNLMLRHQNIDEIIDVLIEEDVKIVTTGAGSPRPYMAKLKAADFIVLPVVASVRMAQSVEKLGVDGIIVEGMEAGGHIGAATTMSLLPQVVDHVALPVIGAGGLGDSRGIVASFALGACGVQLGTVFLTAAECPIAANYQQMVLAATDTGTVVTGHSQGAPVRSLRSPLTDKYLALELAQAPAEELAALTVGSLGKAVTTGDLEGGSFMAGQIAGMLTEIRPAKQIMAELVAGIEPVLAQLGQPLF